MSRKRILYDNMLDAPGAVVTPSDENATYKFYYAYDRDNGMPALFGDATSPSVVIDQGASGTMRPDRFIAAGHNWDGFTITIKWSPNNIDWSNVAASWTQMGNNLVNVPFDSPDGIKRYWGYSITGNGSTIPQQTEVFLGPTYEMERNPSYGSQVRGTKDGVKRTELDGGGVVYYDRWGGLNKKYRKWPLARATDAMAANINDLDALWAGKKPVFVEDDDGSWFFAELLKRLDQAVNGLDYSSYELEVLEVLPV
jgi:hypothetical protein